METVIEIPEKLKEILNNSEYESAIKEYAQKAGDILKSNDTVFFPNYTDHGPEHVSDVLKSMVGLVPKEVWKENVLTAADAVVMIGSAILHDIAMHLSVKGFLELVSEDTRFKPLDWFDGDHQGYTADRPWPELWDDYQREARKFSDRALGKIIGEKEAQNWKFDGLSKNTGSWEANDYLVIGEFIRRHHARLAHEIAMYGFPGIKVGKGKKQYPALGKHAEDHQLELLADFIGLTARSHWMDLRVCKSYIDSHDEYKDMTRPMDVAILYPMALLRVADYLQIEQKRAPFILLQLKDPQSPTSIEEWEKHHAIRQLGETTDPYGIKVVVDKGVGLKTFLQLEELLNGLQAEMDHSTAVLDEVYGRVDNLKLLSLAKRRVYSNLFEPEFRNKLPYVPEKTGFSADPNILSLLVEPLYGQEPSVGVRELIQNAVDAVLEREAWEKKHGKVEGLPELDEGADVLVDFIEKEDGKWILRVQDRGIGMTADTIQNYFLRAGASFRNSPQWTKEFTDDKGKSEVIRSGRFGVGAFAIFLLGSEFKVWTRHISKSEGCMIDLCISSQNVQILDKISTKVGTIIEVELNSSAIDLIGECLDSRYPHDKLDFYCWSWPKVVKRVINTETITLPQSVNVPDLRGKTKLTWFPVNVKGVSDLQWTFNYAPDLICNGIAISKPGYIQSDIYIPPDFGYYKPNVTIVDREGDLPIDVKRYVTRDGVLPYSDEIVNDVLLSVLAHALVCVPSKREQLFDDKSYHPLRISGQKDVGRLPDSYVFSNGYMNWWSNQNSFVVDDPWTFSLLGSKKCVIVGGNVRNSRYVAAIGEALGPWLLDIQYCLLYKNISLFHNSATSFLDSLKRLIYELKINGMASIKAPVDSIGFSCLFPSNSDSIKDLDPRVKRGLTLKNLDDGKIVSCRYGIGCLALSREIDLALRDVIQRHYMPKNGWCFVVEMDISNKSCVNPESLVAKVWKKYLGSASIPLSFCDRKELVDQVCHFPEMKRHIDVWRTIKDKGIEVKCDNMEKSNIRNLMKHVDQMRENEKSSKKNM